MVLQVEEERKQNEVTCWKNTIFNIQPRLSIKQIISS